MADVNELKSLIAKVNDLHMAIEEVIEDGSPEGDAEYARRWREWDEAVNAAARKMELIGFDNRVAQNMLRDEEYIKNLTELVGKLA